MSALRSLGLVLLGAGFLAAAFVSVRDTDARAWQSIDWKWYAASMLVGAVGVALVRRTSGRASGASWKTQADLERLQQALIQLNQALDRMVAQPPGVYEVHGIIDEQLMPELNRFVMAREALIAQFGLQSYADVMTEFAAGERSLNRAWSASADGYADEVQAALQRAQHYLAAAHRRLTALHSPPSPAAPAAASSRESPT